jgi:transposase
VRAAAGQLHPATTDRRDPGADRYRKKLIEARTSELQRLAKVLEDSGIKIDSVASKLTTLSARDMIEALIAGERDPAVLADLARGVMRKKIPVG